MNVPANVDRNTADIDKVLNPVYGALAAPWPRRRRRFVLSVSGLFGHRGGKGWGVRHYRLQPAL